MIKNSLGITKRIDEVFLIMTTGKKIFFMSMSHLSQRFKTLRSLNTFG